MQTKPVVLGPSSRDLTQPLSTPKTEPLTRCFGNDLRSQHESYGPSSLGCSGGSPKLRCVYLEVTLVNGQNYSIPVEGGHSVEEELELFLKREGRYAVDWVQLQKASRKLFVRYEQIILVSPMD
jgi:hypothetical protein